MRLVVTKGDDSSLEAALAGISHEWENLVHKWVQPGEVCPLEVILGDNSELRLSLLDHPHQLRLPDKTTLVSLRTDRTNFAREVEGMGVLRPGDSSCIYPPLYESSG